jgi:Domain of unknown function (DUF4389)
VYPISFEADYEAEGRNRLTTFFRFLVVIPWALAGLFWILAAGLLAVVSWFALLATGRYPQRLYDFNVKAVRFAARLYGLYYLLTDRFPPFGGNPDDAYPIRLEAEPPKAEYSRVKVLVRVIIAIPVLLLGYVQEVIGSVCALIAWFAIVFTGRMPEALFKAIRSAVAYQTRAAAYMLLLTEDFPPFDYDESRQAAPA